MRLVVDGGGRRCWELDGDSSSEESLRGLFLARDDNERFDGGVWDVGRTGVFSIVSDAENETSDVMQESFVLTA